MRHFDKDARQILQELRADSSESEYLDLIWLQRYPQPFPKSSNGWPYRQHGETPAKNIRVVK